MMVGFSIRRIAAAATAFVGQTDPREFRREIWLVKAVFNRSQVAVSVSPQVPCITHSRELPEESEATVYLGILAAMAAAVADYLVNRGPSLLMFI